MAIDINISLFHQLNNNLYNLSLHDCIKSRVLHIINDNESNQMHDFGVFYDMQDIKTNIHDRNIIDEALLFHKKKILYYETRIKSLAIQIIENRMIQIVCTLKNDDDLIIQIVL